MSLDRDKARFDHGKRQAIASANALLKFIIERPRMLKDPTGRILADCQNWKGMIDRGEELPEWAYANIDDAYEVVVSKLTGLPKVPKHIDRKRKGLRYG